MDLDGHCRISFGRFELDWRARELFRDSTKIALQDKPFQVLAMLIQSPHQLITRRQLADAVWPDSHVEIDFCLNTAIRKVRKALGDSANHARLIETAGKLGYRFIGEIRKPKRDVGEGAEEPERSGTNGHSLTRLAILPFEDLGVAPDGCYAKGIMLHLVTRLAHHHKQLAVIVDFSRQQRYAYPQRVREESEADYLLTGSVLRSAGKIRVDVELIEQSHRSCIWAQTYLRSEIDPILVQDDIVAHIMGSVLRQMQRRNSWTDTEVNCA